jgi:superfamily II DNA or RNA helicase
MVLIKKVNELDIFIDADRSILYEISDHFTFFVDGYKWMPAYKKGVWDGKIRLFKVAIQTLPCGLIGKLVKFLNDNEYEYKIDQELKKLVNFDKELEEFESDIDSLTKLPPKGKYQFQLDLFHQAVRYNKALILSPTGSGKSQIIYFLMRFFFEQVEENILIITPTIQLVEQLFEDFKTYVNDRFSIESTCSKVGGSNKSSGSNKKVVISTWQSAIRKPFEWFEQFGVFICDEAHLADSKSISTIISLLPNVKFRFGLTGTIENQKTHILTLNGFFGPTLSLNKTEKLMKDGVLAPLEIEIQVIEYPQRERYRVAKEYAGYQEEIKWITSNPIRNNLILDNAFEQDHNVLILFNFVKNHGKVLYDAALKRESDKKIFFIHGGVDVEEREEARKYAEENDNTLIIASYGVFSTGVNIKNLHTIIFAHPFKAKIRNLQSIGRSLRLNKNKKSAKLIDIVDDLSYNGRRNTTLIHSSVRIGQYKNEHFEFRIVPVRLEQSPSISSK